MLVVYLLLVVVVIQLVMIRYRRVGTDATYAPLDLKIKIVGKLDGFDIDIINAVAKEEGIEADIQNLNF